MDRCWEPLFSIGCSKVSSARDKGYAAMFLKPIVSAATCLVQNHRILLVLQGVVNNRKIWQLALRSLPTLQRIGSGKS